MKTDSATTGAYKKDQANKATSPGVLTSAERRSLIADVTPETEMAVRRHVRRYAALFGIANFIAVAGATVYMVAFLPGMVTRELTDRVHSEIEVAQASANELVESTRQTVEELSRDVARSKGDVVALDSAMWGNITDEQRSLHWGSGNSGVAENDAGLFEQADALRALLADLDAARAQLEQHIDLIDNTDEEKVAGILSTINDNEQAIALLRETRSLTRRLPDTERFDISDGVIAFGPSGYLSSFTVRLRPVQGIIKESEPFEAPNGFVGHMFVMAGGNEPKIFLVACAGDGVLTINESLDYSGLAIRDLRLEEVPGGRRSWRLTGYQGTVEELRVMLVGTGPNWERIRSAPTSVQDAGN